MGVDLLAMKKILVVDDNTINLKLADKILKENPDYKPVMVPSGARALQFLSKNVPDMILLDIMMPDMDGFETLTKIRADERLKEVPVLFLTADTEPETADKVKVNITELSDKQKKLIYALSKDQIDDDVLEQLCNVLKNGGK